MISGFELELTAFDGDYPFRIKGEKSTLFPLASGAVIVNGDDSALGFDRVNGWTADTLSGRQAKMAVLGGQSAVNLLKGDGKCAFVLLQFFDDVFQCVLHGFGSLERV